MRLNRSFKCFFALYFVTLIFCVGARIWLKLNAMDPTTGFYTGADALVGAFNTVLGIYIAALFLRYLLRRTDSDYPVIRRDTVTGVFAMITGAMILLYQLEALGIPGFAVINPGIQLRGITLTISVVLGVISGCMFIFTGVRTIWGNGHLYGGMVTLIGGIWMMLTLIFKFNSYTTLTTISDNLLTVLFMLFGALFMVGHARTLLGVSRKDGRNYTIPSGLSTSLIGLLLVVPNWVHSAANTTLTLSAPMLGSFESLFIFFLSIYALLFVRHVCLSIRMV